MDEQDNNPNEDDLDIYFDVPANEETDEEIFYGSINNSNQNSPDNSDSNESNSLDNETDQTSESDRDEEPTASTQRRISYNISLPVTHSYLGNDLQELGGRVVLEEESIVKIPLLCLPGVVLVPGQNLPLQFEGSHLLETVKDIIENDKIFGLVSNYRSNYLDQKNVYNNVNLDNLGTIAEVRSYGLENNGTVLKVKAEGRERFLIKETFDHNRKIMANVFILPEINIRHPFDKDIGLSSLGYKYNRKLVPQCTPIPSFVYDLYHTEFLMNKIRSNLNQWASFSKGSSETGSNVYENRTVSQRSNINQAQTSERTASNNQVNEQSDATTTTTNHTSTTAIQPVSVNTTRTVVTRIQAVNDEDEEDEEDEDSDEDGFNNKSYAPSTPVEFSFWVLANLPLTDHQRLSLLSLNSPIQRLRWQASFFEKCLSLSCVNCNILICNCEDIFTMSSNGVQNSFVNSAGSVHDTLTLRKIANFNGTGRPSSEFSWFPPYKWQIITCSRCRSHLGWKFITDENLMPKSFFGICRRSIKLSIDENKEDEGEWRPLI